LIGWTSTGAVITLEGELYQKRRRGINCSNKNATRKETEQMGDSKSRGFEQWMGETATQKL